MEYHIKNKVGNTIASFEHECDRDLCLDCYVDYYGEDCGLEPVDS
ncbi:hypothetical protein LCGC14_1000200 [marine sediment metagenome]|uniref:Uncharacterized protein n=1 Tax=marine sediment metagenome TaxID=412755 RepID=A0A0F9N800_9ZZZZ